MSEKVFQGQYRDEKILLRTHPHILLFFLQKIHLFVIYGVIILLLQILGWYVFSEYFTFFIVFSVILLGVYIWYLFWMRNRTRYTFTSRRCICFIRKGLWKTAYREIHLTELRHAIPKRRWLGAFFGYGLLILVDKDEQKIIYDGIREHKEIARYLARIVDYIKLNGHTDDISEYVPKKIRKSIHS